MESKHTPGPWEYDGPPHNIIVWSSPENRICFMTSDGPTEANARLIAAAPDLLAALKTLSAVYDGIYVKMSDGEMELCRRAWSEAEAALSKAGA